MKKSLNCIILASSIIFAMQVEACGPGPYFTPSNYQLFRVAESGKPTTVEYNPHASDNIAAWQELCAHSALYNDIYEVVYHYTKEQLQKVLQSRKTDSKNTFLQWIVDNNKENYLQLLILAKHCENTRNAMNDPWYFPSKHDPVKMSLADIEHQAHVEVVKNTELSDRYALQQMRAMFAQNKWESCLDLWNMYARTLPEQNVMRMMMINYVYGAASHIGKNEKAQLIFNEQGSKWFASYLLEPNVHEGVNSMVKAYETYPNCPKLIEMLQVYLGEDGLDWRYRDSSVFKDILSLSQRVIREQKVNDLAPWYYSASFIEDWLGNNNAALKYSRLAKQSKTTPFISESIHLWNIYIEYKNAIPSDQKLLTDLQWLAAMQIRDAGERRENGGNFYDRRYVYSCWKLDYWHDAMRRIVHTVLVPKYMKQGNTTRALELANYGANWYFRNDSLCTDCWHSDDFFSLLYEQTAQVAERYVSHTLSPQSALDKWLANGGNTMSDYLWDAVGTMYLREAKYAKAANAFEKVSPSFQQILNDEFWTASLFSEPFSPQNPRRVRRPDCKLSFAREMRDLEIEMRTAKNVNRRANAQIRYAIGLRNSFISCRALTQYIKPESTFVLQNRKEKLLLSVQLIDAALKMYDNAEDAAQANLLLLNFSTIVEQFPHTMTADYVCYVCDNYYDYHCEQIEWFNDWDTEEE